MEAVPGELPIGQQLELVNRLLAMCRDVPPATRIELTAGELLALLKALAATAGRPAATFTGRAPRGSVWPRVEAYLREHGRGSIAQISNALAVSRQGVHIALKRHACERIAGTFFWRLRTREPLSLSSADERS